MSVNRNVSVVFQKPARVRHSLKPSFLVQNGRGIINPALPDEGFAMAVGIAQGAFNPFRPEVLDGSSRGGSIAKHIERNNATLVLLCPAGKNRGSAATAKSEPRFFAAAGTT